LGGGEKIAAKAGKWKCSNTDVDLAVGGNLQTEIIMNAVNFGVSYAF